MGRGMSLFMAGGELGRTVGPLLFVWAVSVWTFEGLYQIAFFSWIVSFVLLLQMRRVTKERTTPTRIRSLLPVAARLLLPVFVVLIGRSFLISSIASNNWPVASLLLYALIDLAIILVTILVWVIIILAILSWVGAAHSYQNPVIGILRSIADPLILPVRKVIPPIGMIDLSPMIVIIGLYCVLIALKSVL